MKILFLVRDMKVAAKKQEDLLSHLSFVKSFFKDFNPDTSMVDLVNKHKPDVIFKYGFRTPFEKDLDKVDIPKFIYLVDYFPPKGAYKGRQQIYADFMRESKWDFALLPVTYMSDFVKQDGQVKETLISPFSVDIDMFKNIKINKDVDVSAMFVSRTDVYPNRKMVLNAINQIKGLNIVTGKRAMIAYIDIINRSKIFVTSNNVFGSMSMKYTECMSCGTFLLADEPEDWELFGYKPGYHFVIYKDVNDLKDKIKYFLKNEKEREEIALNGMKFVREFHNHDVRVKAFNKFVEDRYNIK